MSISFTSQFETLLSPITIGSLNLKNRLVMGSMHMRLGFSGTEARKLAAFYKERARGGASLIITGGVSPNSAGRMEENASVLASEEELPGHKIVTHAIHEVGSACVMQILHAGRYAKHAEVVAPSSIKAPINSFHPHQLTEEEVEKTVHDYLRCALLAKEAGYDGVDIMGSEGYLINEFVSPCTNTRSDKWGGSFENRISFPLEIIRRIRSTIGQDFLILFRISAADLVSNGTTAEETIKFSQALESFGTNALTTGIGWHESRIPTIAYMVPRGAWRAAAARIKQSVSIPVIATNRINTPELAEEILSSGDADLVALARPLLADPFFIRKIESKNRSSITPCIACNQACLDYIFTDRVATCLVNPRAGRESELNLAQTLSQKRIAVIGAGAAGISFSITAAARGHKVTIFDSAPHIGGQLELARRVPGKEEFSELLRHYDSEIHRLGIHLHLSTPFNETYFLNNQYDLLVIATGVKPRIPNIPGIYHQKVSLYPDVLNGSIQIGKNVAIIGAGPIAFDIAEFLNTSDTSPISVSSFHKKWGVDLNGNSPGALVKPAPTITDRSLHILHRSNQKPAPSLGISTGWILRSALKQQQVLVHEGCSYKNINDQGLHFTVNEQHKVLPVDNVIICAGQESSNDVAAHCANKGIPFHLIGGAKDSNNLDACRAISEGYALGLTC
jgi:2,4-dienoyl-CoA reductase (NADPH2)